MKTETIELPFNEPDFLEAWNEWQQYRKERKLPKYVPTGLKKTLTMLKNISENNKDKAIKIIEHSITMNYQGLYPPPEKKQEPQPRPVVFQNQPQPRPAPPVNNEPVSDQAMRDWMETMKEEKRVDYMPMTLYEWLEKRGEFRPYTKAQKNQFLISAAKHRRQQLIDEGSPKLPEFLKMFETSQWEGDHLKDVIKLAKKFLLMDYLQKKEA